MSKSDKIIVVGAGLSGPLIAAMMRKRGYEVSLYESRPDMRKVEMAAGRSINLALSDRGLIPLDEIGVKEEVMATTVPMYGRMIHDNEGNTRLSRYSGREGEAINSVSRAGLNIQLINKAESLGVNVFYNEKCVGVDHKKGIVNFKSYTTGIESDVHADLIIGADGFGSAVRESMYDNHRETRFSFSQDYLSHGYKELHIPPGDDGSFRIDKNALHIWPRGGHMVIALPNEDGSFTVTLFHSFDGDEGFDNLNDDKSIMAFFKKYYSDILQHMPDVLTDFNENPTGNLATVKCYPWQSNGRSILIGDSAHAVVPFYGQGMNCSFEDCSVFTKIHDEHPGNWKWILETYQQTRKKDADAIGDLAVENYVEMRDSVAHPDFKEKRELEMKLEATYPDYKSKYSMVTFSPEIPYSMAMNLGRAQDEFLLNFCSKIDDVSGVDIASLKESLDVLKKQFV